MADTNRTTVRPFAFTDEDYESMVRIHEAAWPGQPDSAAFWRRLDAEGDSVGYRRRLVAEWEGRPVGIAWYGPPPLASRPGQYVVQLRVSPRFEGRGIGSELLRHVTRDLREKGANVLEAESRDDLPRGRRFLEVHGFEPLGRAAPSELDVSAFSPDVFRETVERVERSSVRLRDWTGLAGVETAERRLHDLFGDLQHDVTGQEDSTLPPFAAWIASYRDNPDLLPDALIVAIDGDAFVGVSQIWGSDASDELFYTGLTGVRRKYRRRGLATAMKVRALGAIASRRTAGGRGPFVRTTNEEANPMRKINVALGFVALPASLYHTLRLGPVSQV